MSAGVFWPILGILCNIFILFIPFITGMNYLQSTSEFPLHQFSCLPSYPSHYNPSLQAVYTLKTLSQNCLHFCHVNVSTPVTPTSEDARVLKICTHTSSYHTNQFQSFPNHFGQIWVFYATFSFLFIPFITGMNYLQSTSDFPLHQFSCPPIISRSLQVVYRPFTPLKRCLTFVSLLSHFCLMFPQCFQNVSKISDSSTPTSQKMNPRNGYKLRQHKFTNFG